ncbi:hypothetical protein CCP2SC5_520007 [Azospirillaceae bacterium]
MENICFVAGARPATDAELRENIRLNSNIEEKLHRVGSAQRTPDLVSGPCRVGKIKNSQTRLFLHGNLRYTLEIIRMARPPVQIDGCGRQSKRLSGASMESDMTKRMASPALVLATISLATINLCGCASNGTAYVPAYGFIPNANARANAPITAASPALTSTLAVASTPVGSRQAKNQMATNPTDPSVIMAVPISTAASPRPSAMPRLSPPVPMHGSDKLFPVIAASGNNAAPMVAAPILTASATNAVVGYGPINAVPIHVSRIENNDEDIMSPPIVTVSSMRAPVITAPTWASGVANGR